MAIFRDAKIQSSVFRIDHWKDVGIFDDVLEKALPDEVEEKKEKEDTELSIAEVKKLKKEAILLQR